MTRKRGLSKTVKAYRATLIYIAVVVTLLLLLEIRDGGGLF